MDNRFTMPDTDTDPASASHDSITRVAGIEVGHFTDTRRPTGCSVVIARAGAVAGVDVRGAAPGTRETDLLHPSNLVDRAHAILLAGGSAWGLDAAAGVMRWLEEQGIGLDVKFGLVPIVPGAVLFDLPVGDARIRPDAAAGYQACLAASRQPPAQGNVGAGAGALVGKLFGLARAMRGGIGSASVTLDGVTVGHITSAARHGEDGPIALALVKRSTSEQATLDVLTEDAVARATQVVVVPTSAGHAVTVEKLPRLRDR